MRMEKRSGKEQKSISFLPEGLSCPNADIGLWGSDRVYPE
jgi:hypothetical protein